MSSQTSTATSVTTLHPLLSERWSPRAFRRDAKLAPAQAHRLLEAARWAPSAANSQPWRFILAAKGTPNFTRIHDALMPGNQTWAGNASALLLVAAQNVDDAGQAQPWAAYDTGQAVAALVTQAQHEGLSTHQMGGFHAEALTAAFSLDPSLQPMVVVAIGTKAEAHTLPEPLATREVAARTRLPLEALLLEETELPLTA